ncbi:MAG TPA: lytic murein transglycosylase [Xanthobacteraceae bacterium]|jgi:lytic murein transglycosylase|nr:lytic murein transglycosylase [Xanthobacteraceae bacterium]
MTNQAKRRTGALLAVLLVVAPATAFGQANCRNTGAFEPWLAAFKKEAAAQGISPAAIAAAAPYLVLDQRIINIDRGQRFFAQNFLEISDKMLAGGRLPNGAAQIKKHQALFAREEKEFGVPASVITAFWGLESDFGSGQGKDQSIKSLATLAYDCRRPEMFRGHLFDALRLIDSGDLRADEMIGSWAGELGQTQMMPSEYMAHAIDYDGDGKRNLIKSASDVIGSTGKYLVHLGWKRGEPWLQEVRVPANLPWKDADLSVQHPRSKWAAWGVTRADGKPLPNDNVPASVVLPVGRFGPAFMAYDNFQAYLKWNQSLNYSLTAAYYATRLDGAPPMNKGSANIPKITFEETRELQELLQKRGYDVGRVDGVLGLKSRVAIRELQIKSGLPADGWPTAELLAAARTGR